MFKHKIFIVVFLLGSISSKAGWRDLVQYTGVFDDLTIEGKSLPCQRVHQNLSSLETHFSSTLSSDSTNNVVIGAYSILIEKDGEYRWETSYIYSGPTENCTFEKSPISIFQSTSNVQQDDITTEKVVGIPQSFSTHAIEPAEEYIQLLKEAINPRNNPTTDPSDPKHKEASPIEKYENLFGSLFREEHCLRDAITPLQLLVERVSLLCNKIDPDEPELTITSPRDHSTGTGVLCAEDFQLIQKSITEIQHHLSQSDSKDSFFENLQKLIKDKYTKLAHEIWHSEQRLIFSFFKTPKEDEEAIEEPVEISEDEGEEDYFREGSEEKEGPSESSASDHSQLLLTLDDFIGDLEENEDIKALVFHIHSRFDFCQMCRYTLATHIYDLVKNKYNNKFPNLKTAVLGSYREEYHDPRSTHFIERTGAIESHPTHNTQLLLKSPLYITKIRSAVKLAIPISSSPDEEEQSSAEGEDSESIPPKLMMSEKDQIKWAMRNAGDAHERQGGVGSSKDDF